MGEFALCEVLREISVQEQEHAIDLATALGIEVPRIPDLDGEASGDFKPERRRAGVAP